MVKLLIIADDFTGALDTGVQFSKVGISTMVTSNVNIDFARVADEIQVLSIDTETRHLSKEDAYECVFTLSQRAARAGIAYIYKKVDSCLRGNPGIELLALMKATNTPAITLVAAFPGTERITKNGIQYYKGTPIHKSEFANDPVNPIVTSLISEVIALETDIEVVTVLKSQYDDLPTIINERHGIIVCDAENNTDLSIISKQVLTFGRAHIVAGSGGFAEMIPAALAMQAKSKPVPVLFAADKTLYISGSVHAVSIEQIRGAAKNGVPVCVVNPRNDLTNNYDTKESHSRLLAEIINEIERHKKYALVSAISKSQILDVTNLTDKLSIARSEIAPRLISEIGKLGADVANAVYPCNLVVFGGDTLFQMMKMLGCSALFPLCEIAPGVVASNLKTKKGQSFLVISKAGSFGDNTTIGKIEKYLQEHKMPACREELT